MTQWERSMRGVEGNSISSDCVIGEGKEIWVWLARVVIG